MLILVADDEEAIGVLVKRLGEGAGHRIDVADTAVQAVDMACEKHYDAAAVDLRLPKEEDGLAAAEALKSLGVPHVLMIAGAGPTEEAAARLEKLGIKVLSKPFLVPELLRALGATA